MSEYEGKWPKCLHPEPQIPQPLIHQCNFRGWHGPESICLADTDQGCPENRDRSKEHCDCSNNDPSWAGARHHPELDGTEDDISKAYYEARNKLVEKPMVEIELPKTIKVGGYDYSIEYSKEFDKELHSADNMGECADRLRRIRIRTDLSPQQNSETFIHEILHAIDGIYTATELSEPQIHALANGLLQVMEQLNIRFVARQ